MCCSHIADHTMGSGQSSRKKSSASQVVTEKGTDVNFDDFMILRAIGKGSFGKVCIVQKKDSLKMYAMKYMNKSQCVQKEAFRNVIREIEILAALEHPFLVNLWFTFQDEEDMFMVVDLLLGGDIRYHLQQETSFEEPRVRLYICELALALGYLRSHRILHRDIKPDNILLDEAGHVHITDFNIATVLGEKEQSTSMSGTKPYMAPEVFECALDLKSGYGFSADWWSLGVCAYEMLTGQRPYDIHSGTPLEEVRHMMYSTCLKFPNDVSSGMVDLVRQMLTHDPENRLSTVEESKKHHYLSHIDFQAIYNGQSKPIFVPNKDQLNCDPTFELEEMIIEAKPLHKKKKRLSKQSSRREHLPSTYSGEELEAYQTCLENIEKQFIIYNRERELEKREMEKKERDWEEELRRSMDAT